VRLDVADLRVADRESPSMRTRYGDRAVIVGTIDPGDAALSLVTIVADGNPTSAERRELAMKGVEGEHERFEVDGVACVQSTHDLVEGLREVSMRAFPNAAGQAFELAVSSVTGPDRVAFERAAFEEVVSSLRFAWLRRGVFGDYPPAVIETMHAHLHGDVPVLEARLDVLLERLGKIARGEEPAPEPAVDFAYAELLSRLEHPIEGITAIYDRVISTLHRASPADARSAQDRLLLALSEEGSGRLYVRDHDFGSGHELLAGRLETGIRCFWRALGQAQSLRPEFRAGITYNLACAHALVPDGENALKRLAEAIEIDPAYRDLAREDPDFRLLRADERFQELVAKAR
jgi:tetratricopeptide (TPR) repeat protein